MVIKRRKPKPPIIPRCLCGSFLHWILQIPSPSKYFIAAAYRPKKAEKYFDNLHQYEMAEILRKVTLRTCTREEWHRLRRAGRATDGR